MSEKTRPLQMVPIGVLIFLAVMLLAQLIWHVYFVVPRPHLSELKSPPPLEVLKILSLGDKVTSAKLWSLWLQNVEVQQGQFLSYRQLDYTALIAWLEAILLLDPRAEYPLFSASYHYSSVQDDEKLRRLLDFIYQEWDKMPSERWRWLAHAAILAKHRLEDLPLALRYAEAVAAQATAEMPNWVQQMHIFILEDMGELERARLEIGGLLSSGTLTDKNEIRFFQQKLLELEQKSHAANMLQ